MATEPPITISQPNGSADSGPTKNGYWLRSMPTPGEQSVENSGKEEGREVLLRIPRGAVQGEPCPRECAQDRLRSSRSCHRPVPSTFSP